MIIQIASGVRYPCSSHSPPLAADPRVGGVAVQSPFLNWMICR
jgi:hypothetical protein